MYEGRKVYTSGLSAVVGKRKDEFSPVPISYDEMRPGCYDPKARVEDMRMNWVEASLCFPTFPRFCGQTFTEAKDRELGLAGALCVDLVGDGGTTDMSVLQPAVLGASPRTVSALVSSPK